MESVVRFSQIFIAFISSSPYENHNMRKNIGLSFMRIMTCLFSIIRGRLISLWMS